MLDLPLTLLLGLEATVAALLCIPVKAVTRVALLLTGVLRQQAVQIMVGTCGAMLLIVMAFSGIRMRQLFHVMSQPAAASGSGTVFQEARQELYEEGLHSCLIVSCLLLGMTIARIDNQLRRNRSLQANFEVMMKQAKGTQQEYMRQLEEKATASKPVAAAGPPPEAEQVSSDLRKENAALKEETEQLRRDVRQGAASVAALKKQTEGLQLEFNRLIEENESLRSQLSIFDRKYSQGDDKKRS